MIISGEKGRDSAIHVHIPIFPQTETSYVTCLGRFLKRWVGTESLDIKSLLKEVEELAV